MASKPQTAIRGVFSVAIVNVLARIVGYGKHILIAAYIGLSAGLDAYFVAVTAVSIFILTFGDVFDSLGIPRLVRTLQGEGEEAFRRLAGSVLILACILSIGLCLLLLAVSPWTPWIAPGFTPDKKALVLRNLYYLAPMAILYLPYHAMGSVLRARRRFVDFYIGELFNSIVMVATLYAGRNHPFIVPIASSVGYAAIFVYVAMITRGEVSLCGAADWKKLRELFHLLMALLPLYLGSYLFPLVDRAFASFLPTGALSALSYGLLVVSIPSSILVMENIFITPLSETKEKRGMMNQILCGVLILSIPMAVFAAQYAGDIIRIGLERGVFTKASTDMTAGALACYAVALPAFMFWPICYRTLQVLEKLRVIAVITGVALLINAGLNYLFMRMGLGIEGLALATSIANFALVLGAMFLLKHYGIDLFARNVLKVGLIALGASGAAVLSTRMLLPAQSTIGTLLRGIVFIGLVVLFYAFSRNPDIRQWRTTIYGDLFGGLSKSQTP